MMTAVHCKPCLYLSLAALLLTSCAASMTDYVPPLFDPLPARHEVDTAHAILVVRPLVQGHWRRAHARLRVAESAHRVGQIFAGIDQSALPFRLQIARHLYAEGRIDEALAHFARCAADGFIVPELYLEHGLGLLNNGRHRSARILIFAGQDRFPDDAALAAAADRAIDEDPLLFPPVLRTLVAADNNLIKSLGGGSTITLRYVEDGVTLAALKPDQEQRQSMYRSEIAFYRLCEVLRCRFRVPYNEEVRISRQDFNTLYGRLDTPAQRGYRTKFHELVWRTVDGDTYLYATFKEWMPAFVGFPIEVSEVWKGWLSATSRVDYGAPATDFLPAIAKAAGSRGQSGHSRRMEWAARLSLGDLVAQISDVLVVDFLTNNWDRFAGEMDNYGANCHFVEGGLLALDNGAAFPPWHTDRVVRRLRLTQRFSKALIHGIRRLEYDKTLNRLFPTPTRDEIRAFDLFWERRDQLLTTVDELIERHGEAEILVF